MFVSSTFVFHFKNEVIFIASNFGEDGVTNTCENCNSNKVNGDVSKSHLRHPPKEACILEGHIYSDF